MRWFVKDTRHEVEMRNMRKWYKDLTGNEGGNDDELLKKIFGEKGVPLELKNQSQVPKYRSYTTT